MSRTNPEPDELIWCESLLFAIVCAPKGTDRQKVENFARMQLCGTTAGWVLCEEEKQNPTQCPDFEDREHWLFNC